MSNLSKFLNSSNDKLSADVVFCADIIGSAPTQFSLTATIAGQMSAAASNFQSAVTAVNETEAVYRAAVQAQANARAALQSVFQSNLAVSYASPSVSNEKLASAGLPPRTERSSFVSPTTPLEFLADAFSNGSVKLKWKRNGNTSSTVFNIEAKTEDGAWELVWSGTQSKTTFSNYAPGVEVSFRVYASKNDEFSEASNIAVIYSSGGQSELQIAA